MRRIEATQGMLAPLPDYRLTIGVGATRSPDDGVLVRRPPDDCVTLVGRSPHDGVAFVARVPDVAVPWAAAVGSVTRGPPDDVQRGHLTPSPRTCGRGALPIAAEPSPFDALSARRRQCSPRRVGLPRIRIGAGEAASQRL